MSSYRPGQCNIGRQQRTQRLTVAAVGFALSVGYVGGYVAGVVPHALLPGVFVPLAIAFEWGLQAYTAFCVQLAVLGRYDLRSSGGTGPVGNVEDPRDRYADRVHAAKITTAGIALAGVTTLGLIFAL